jgi:hypothetical protein
MERARPTAFGTEERVLLIGLAKEVRHVWEHLTELGLISETEGERRAAMAQGISIALCELEKVPHEADVITFGLN